MDYRAAFAGNRVQCLASAMSIARSRGSLAAGADAASRISTSGAMSARARGARAHPFAGDSSGLDRRLDLPLRQRAPAGGRDRCAGRRQYLYHPAWRARRDREKFDEMLELRAGLPKLRERRSTQLLDEGCRASACSRPRARCSTAASFASAARSMRMTTAAMGSRRCSVATFDPLDGTVVFDYVGKTGRHLVHRCGAAGSALSRPS